MTYQGSCHCGNIRFEVQGEVDGATTCNCSICQRKGILMWFVPRQSLHLLTPEENVSTYTFNQHAIRHHFCSECGIHPFGEATDPEGNAVASINIRCLESIDIDTVPLQQFDGRSL